MMRMVVLSVTLLLASNVMAQKLQPFVYIGIGGAEYDSNGTAEGSFIGLVAESGGARYARTPGY